LKAAAITAAFIRFRTAPNAPTACSVARTGGVQRYPSPSQLLYRLPRLDASGLDRHHAATRRVSGSLIFVAPVSPTASSCNGAT